MAQTGHKRERGGTGLERVVDRVLPGPGSALDQSSETLQRQLQRLTRSRSGGLLAFLLRGNEWLGHPLHPVLVMVPIGAWSVTGWYDARAARQGDERFDHVADAALRVGVVTAVPAAVTGVAQFLDTRGPVRREAAVHATLNNVALTLYVASIALRGLGRRREGRLLATIGHLAVSAGGFLGSDLAYRLGVGVRPQVVRDPDLPASGSPTDPVDDGGVRHV